MVPALELGTTPGMNIAITPSCCSVDKLWPWALAHTEFLYVFDFFPLCGTLLLPSLYEFCGQVLCESMFECHVTFERIFQKNSNNFVDHRVTLQYVFSRAGNSLSKMICMEGISSGFDLSVVTRTVLL